MSWASDTMDEMEADGLPLGVLCGMGILWHSRCFPPVRPYDLPADYLPRAFRSMRDGSERAVDAALSSGMCSVSCGTVRPTDLAEAELDRIVAKVVFDALRKLESGRDAATPAEDAPRPTWKPTPRKARTGGLSPKGRLSREFRKCLSR